MENRNLTETSAEIVRTAQGRFLSVATEIDDEFTLVWLISYRHLTGSMTRVGFLFWELVCLWRSSYYFSRC